MKSCHPLGFAAVKQWVLRVLVTRGVRVYLGPKYYSRARKCCVLVLTKESLYSRVPGIMSKTINNEYCPTQTVWACDARADARSSDEPNLLFVGTWILDYSTAEKKKKVDCRIGENWHKKSDDCRMIQNGVSSLEFQCKEGVARHGTATQHWSYPSCRVAHADRIDDTPG